MEVYVEYARPFDDIKDIDDSKDVWTLSVRIVDISRSLIIKDTKYDFHTSQIS